MAWLPTLSPRKALVPQQSPLSPRGIQLNSLCLKFSFFCFFNPLLIGEPAKALKKKKKGKQTKLMSSIRGGKKKPFLAEVLGTGRNSPLLLESVKLAVSCQWRKSSENQVPGSRVCHSRPLLGSWSASAPATGPWCFVPRLNGFWTCNSSVSESRQAVAGTDSVLPAGWAHRNSQTRISAGPVASSSS